VYLGILTKNGFYNILGDFSPNSSGHPARRLEMDPFEYRNEDH
jgi:hypothetical protein